MELVDINHESPGDVRGGRCRCPRCGLILPRRRDVLCESLPCPRCGAMMTRD